MAARQKENPAVNRYTAFADLGFHATIEALKAEIADLYCADNVPWIIGYSGGKDSTATLQLVWLALLDLPIEKRRKPVHVITTDTLVENPVVASWVTSSLEKMRSGATRSHLPITPHRLTPNIDESYWVNLIGRGYPAPRPKFRWCTERLKIRPSNRFILRMVQEHGRAVLLLGARRAESTARAARLNKNRKTLQDVLSENATLPNCYVYTPIDNWANDDVWEFLLMMGNPWGASNKDLMGMYAGASADGECPVVVDTSTPSCGSSRFGCWVCTLVDQDKSMAAMVQNDADKDWMRPLLDLRNDLDYRTHSADQEETSDRRLRDFRRLTGVVQMHRDRERTIPGPYLQSVREGFLRKLLTAQRSVETHRPTGTNAVELVSLDELQEIRRIWVMEKHEIEDSLPGIYRDATGKPYPGRRLDDNLVLGAAEMESLRDVCGADRLHYELTRELLSVERQQRARARRAGLYEKLEKTFKRHFYSDEADATDYARRRFGAREAARTGMLAVAEVGGGEYTVTGKEVTP